METLFFSPRERVLDMIGRDRLGAERVAVLVTQLEPLEPWGEAR
jgi:hypothetical protein